MKHGPTQHAPPADGTCRIDRWNVLLQVKKHARIAQNGARCGSAQKIAIFGTTDNQMVDKTKPHKKQHLEAKNAAFRAFARGVRRGLDFHESSDIITQRGAKEAGRTSRSTNDGQWGDRASAAATPHIITRNANREVAKKNDESLGKSGETANFALPHGTKRGNHPNK